MEIEENIIKKRLFTIDSSLNKMTNLVRLLLFKGESEESIEKIEDELENLEFTAMKMESLVQFQAEQEEETKLLNQKRQSQLEEKKQNIDGNLEKLGKLKEKKKKIFETKEQVSRVKEFKAIEAVEKYLAN